MVNKYRASKILESLLARYPEPKSALNWNTPWELLVATVLSAQCTDERVNKVLPDFFRTWPDAKALADSEQHEVETVIYSTGFYRNKARNLRRAAEIIVNRHAGRVPASMPELTALPGVARKTANIILFGAWGINEGVAVDTHVKRIANRLGLTGHTDPFKVEKDLMNLFARKDWGVLNHCLVLFGRETCAARKPRCGNCELRPLCPWPEKEQYTES
ncbi:MAG: endonuclease III [Desulfovibrionales bacterium]